MQKKISCCGTICSSCDYYPADCQGCEVIEGHVFWLEYTGESICDIYDCCKNQKKYVHCGQCTELPCCRYERDDPTKTPEENKEDHSGQMRNIKEHMEIEKLVSDLYQKDSGKAYESLKVLLQKSREASRVYSFMDDFIQMMEHENSYLRNRGIQLIAANARWDEDNKIDEVIDKYLKHIMDEKPITARQCIQVIPELAQYKKELRADIVEGLKCAKPNRYRESMIPLVQKDIAEALHKIEGFNK